MIRSALTILFSLCVASCGGGSSSSDTGTSSSQQEPSARQVDIDFINTAGKSIDYFVSDANGNELLYEQSNKATSCYNTEINKKSFSWDTPTPLNLNIGARDTNTQTETSNIAQLMLNNTEKAWAISWMDDNELMLSTATQQSSDLPNHYRIRVFSHQDTRVQIISSVISSNEVKKGQLSPYMTLENCSGELYFGAEAISLCDLDAGKSYLLITNGEDLLVAAEEK
ncbi:hypothetical protein C942_00116 [Photobacterium marinum]|uniref:Lipoprotein n=1 Tax=Photobacterium marinum TaxID=1056511 RepID=L8JK02_9GAMM|nr:hypothetical protein [Photobacterium marinum]ELR67809.1 hypothetical protein C942_00116 [Photobacterium marinum]